MPLNTTWIDCNCGGKKYFRAEMCKNCRYEKQQQIRANSTLADTMLRDSASRAKWNGVRKIARQWMEMRGISKTCRVCGFDIAVECCHIRPIADFPLDTLLSEVNSQENLVYLCPNHHVMFDRGLLEL